MNVTFTRTQLVNKAGGNLNILSAAQSLSSEDYGTLNTYLDPLALQLAADQIVDVTGEIAEGDDALIPGEFFLPLAALLADAAKAEFSRAGDQGLAAEAQLAKVTLKRMTAQRATSEPLQVDYF